jgi:hypothetical protein
MISACYDDNGGLPAQSDFIPTGGDRTLRAWNLLGIADLHEHGVGVHYLHIKSG